MKTKFRIITFALLFTAPIVLWGQTNFSGQGLNISVTGTSTLHDWEMKSNRGQVNAVAAVSPEKLDISQLTFTMPVESLKSEHDMMDKNTYNAINSRKHPNITFVLTSVTSVTPSGANTYSVKGAGKLTIAGTTKVTDVTATVKYNPADKSLTCTGTKKFKMSEWGVKPPTVMFGTIKTGDAIAINYNIKIKS
jgi:polyisoprenoid-binding protein YceI